MQVKTKASRGELLESGPLAGDPASSAGIRNMSGIGYQGHGSCMVGWIRCRFALRAENPKTVNKSS